MNPLAKLNEASGGEAARQAELAAKQARLDRWFAETGHRGLLLRRHENLAWATAGQFSARVLIPGETAVGALLLLRDGRRFAILPNNEAARIEAEELPGLGFEPMVAPWHTLDFAATAVSLGGREVATDAPLGGLPVIDFGAMRAPLHAAEVARFRALGAVTARVVSECLLRLEPGVSEYEMEAQVAGQLLTQDILPSVLLMAVDDRVRAYKHAVARGARLERFGMLNLCARQWGLAASVTRFVHFGPLPPALAEGFRVAAEVNAALQHATRPGVRAGELFQVAAEVYANAGVPGEEQLHHQGGAAGYLEREWVATPGGREVVVEPQAFAWNPSCLGGKVEDTILLVEGKVEILTGTPALPEVVTEVGGQAYRSTGPLLRE